MKLPSILLVASCIMAVFTAHSIAEPEFCLSTGAQASFQAGSSLWATPDDLDWRAVLRAHLDDASPSVAATLSLGPNIVFMVPEEVGRILEATPSQKLTEFLSVLSDEQEHSYPRSSRRDHALHNWTSIASRHLHGTRDGLPTYVRMLGYTTSRAGE